MRTATYWPLGSYCDLALIQLVLHDQISFHLEAAKLHTAMTALELAYRFTRRDIQSTE